MKANEVDILIIPGYTGAGEDHWQTRWEAKLSAARRVIQAEWSKPVLADWVDALVRAVQNCDKPILLVAHSLGVPTALHALPQLAGKVCGGFFVAPPDVSNPNIRPKHLMSFGPYPRVPLPFPSIVIASRNDPFCDFATAEKLAQDWHSLFMDAGDSGHLNAESGHGPWPEGLMVFTQFLANLPRPGSRPAETAAEAANAAPAAAETGKPADK